MNWQITICSTGLGTRGAMGPISKSMKAFNLTLLLFLLPLQALSATFTGKVVGVMDGDTIKDRWGRT